MDNKSIIHTEWLACPYCDTLHERLLIKKGDKLKCRYCGSVIDKGVADFRRAFSLALTAFILFIIANNFPFITMNLQGEINTISVFSSIRALFDNGLPVLGVHRLMLHAHTLAFHRLTDNRRVDITAPVDTDWLTMCAQFGFHLP